MSRYDVIAYVTWIAKAHLLISFLYLFLIYSCNKIAWNVDGNLLKLRSIMEWCPLFTFTCLPGKRSTEWNKMDIFPPQFPHSSTHLKSSYMYHINVPCTWDAPCTLRWRHNERDGVWNHQPHDCLLSRLFRRRSKKTSKLRVTGLCAGNWPVNSPHKGPVTRKLFPFDDVIMISVFTVVRGTPVYQVWLNILGVCASTYRLIYLQ